MLGLSLKTEALMVPFLCSPSALLVPALARTIFVHPPPHHQPPISGGNALPPPPQLSPALPLPAGTHSPPRRCPWLWWPEGIVFLGPMGLKQSERHSLAGYHSQGTAQQKMETHMERPIFLFWSLSLRTSRGQRCLWKPK